MLNDFELVLGKISSINFIHEDSRIGLSVSFEFKHGGTNFFKGVWDSTIVPIEEDRSKSKIDLFNFIEKIMIDAKKNKLSDLKNCPVELRFEENYLKEWRILTEVL